MFTIKKSMLAAAVIAATTTLASCGSSGGSDNSGGGNPDLAGGGAPSSQFNFTVQQPEASLADLRKAGTVGEVVEILVGLIIPKVYAIDNLTDDIQVAIVDARGFVTQIIKPVSISQESNGTYSLVLASGARIDCIIAVDVTGINALEIGDKIDPKTGLFTPAIEIAEPFRIDLASTVAYDQFIENVDDFNNISVEELDDIIEAVQELVNDPDFLADSSSLQALIESISQAAADIVETQVALAVLTPDNGPLGSSQGTYEDDKAVIKAFFDDVNTIAYLGGGFVSSDAPTVLDGLQEKAALASDTLSAAQVNFDVLGDLSDTVSTYIDINMIELSDAEQTLTVAEIFAGDPQGSGLTGNVSFSKESVIVNLSGKYAGITLTDLALSITANKQEKEAALTLSGTAESAEAKIVISSGSLTTTNAEFNSALSSDIEEQVEKYLDGFQQATFSLNAELTAKNVEGSPAVFTGDVAVEFIRSKNDFIAYDMDLGEGNRDTADAQAYYNLKSASLSGGFAYNGESFEAAVELSSSNADTFVPVPLSLIESDEVAYTDIVSYSYDGVSRYEVKGSSFNTLITASTETVNYLIIAQNSNEDTRLGTTLADYIATGMNVHCSIEGGSYTVYNASFVLGDNTLELALESDYTSDLSAEPTLELAYKLGNTSLEYNCGGNYRKYEFIEATNDSFDDYVLVRESTGYETRQSDLSDELWNVNLYDGNIDAYYTLRDENDDVVLEQGSNLQATLVLGYDYMGGAPESIDVTYTMTNDLVVIVYNGEELLRRESWGTVDREVDFITRTYEYRDGNSYSYKDEGSSDFN